MIALLDERHRADPSRTVDDTDIGHELGVDVLDVRRQLDILEDQGLTRAANTFGGHSAWISPAGMVAAERVQQGTLRRWKAAATLRRTLRDWREAEGVSAQELANALAIGTQGPVTPDLVETIESAGPLPSPAMLEAWFHRLGRSAFAGEKSQRVATVVGPIEKELLCHVAESPERVFDLEPRQFEELVAEILERMGLEVQLTPQAKDGGRDIIASMPSALGELLAIVECKRYSPDRPVGLDIVERFLYTVRDKDLASLGMIATTSRFTKGALEACERHKYQMLLRDYSHLEEWLERYGTYVSDESSGLWLPQLDL